MSGVEQPVEAKIITEKCSEDRIPGCVWMPELGQYIKATCGNGLKVEGTIVARFGLDIVVRMPEWFCELDFHCHYDNHADLMRGVSVRLEGHDYVIGQVCSGGHSLYLRRLL